MDMNNKDIERKLYEEFEQRKPELFQEILKHTPKMTEEKPSIWQQFKALFTRTRNGISFAMITAVVVLALVLFNPFGPATPQAFSTIALDVNPSIVLELDEDNRVIEIHKNNSDAEIIIGDMDLIGVDSNVAINALIGSMLANGYITEFANSVLLSVNSSDSIREDELKIALSNIIQGLLSNTAINGSVITQSLKLTEEAFSIAELYDISEAKAELILDIIAIDPTMSIDALALLSINDLNLLLDAKNYALENVSKSGSASELSLLTKSEAYDLAITYFSLEQSIVLEYEIELEQEDGMIVYELDLETSTNEYTIVIDAKQGTVLSSEIEVIDDNEDDETDGDDYPSDAIDIATLKELIIEELELDYHLIYEWNIDFEIENGVPVYHVEIDYFDNEINLEINAISGQIYSNSYDPDGFHHEDEPEEEEYEEEEYEEEEDDE
jgi:uncharacterized membrane protein YkoI